MTGLGFEAFSKKKINKRKRTGHRSETFFENKNKRRELGVGVGWEDSYLRPMGKLVFDLNCYILSHWITSK